MSPRKAAETVADGAVEADPQAGAQGPVEVARATDIPADDGTPSPEVDVDHEALDALVAYVEGEVNAAVQAARAAMAAELAELATAAAAVDVVAGDPVDDEFAAIQATWPEGTGWFHANGRAHHVDLGSPSHLRLIAEGAIPVPAEG